MMSEYNDPEWTAADAAVDAAATPEAETDDLWSYLWARYRDMITDNDESSGHFAIRVICSLREQLREGAARLRCQRDDYNREVDEAWDAHDQREKQNRRLTDALREYFGAVDANRSLTGQEWEDGHTRAAETALRALAEMEGEK